MERAVEGEGKGGRMEVEEVWEGKGKAGEGERWKGKAGEEG